MWLRKLTAVLLCSSVMTFGVVADNASEELLNKLEEAYGGDALLNFKTLTIKDRYKTFALGQSGRPDIVDTITQNITLTIDAENRRKSHLERRSGHGGSYRSMNNASLFERVFDGDEGWSFNHLIKTYSKPNSLRYETIGRSHIYQLDTLLAYDLITNSEKVQYLDDVSYHGRAHKLLSYEIENGNSLTVMVESATGLISKMIRQDRVLGEAGYVFSHHRIQDGITYASDTSILSNGQIASSLASRTLIVNADVSSTFVLPENYTDMSDNFSDRSDMIVRKLADNLYYAGKGFAYSVFLDAGDYFIATGGNARLGERFAAVQQFTGTDKPLKYQIVTHHHRDHLAGMDDAANLGASFITVRPNVQSIKDEVNSTLADHRFEFIEGQASLADSAIQVFEISTAHADQFLLVYFPGPKLVFAADHFSTGLKSGPVWKTDSAVIFRRALEALDLDIVGFLGAHHPRQLTVEELRAATEEYYFSPRCPDNWEICAN